MNQSYSSTRHRVTVRTAEEERQAGNLSITPSHFHLKTGAILLYHLYTCDGEDRDWERDAERERPGHRESDRQRKRQSEAGRQTARQTDWLTETVGLYSFACAHKNKVATAATRQANKLTHLPAMWLLASCFALTSLLTEAEQSNVEEEPTVKSSRLENKRNFVIAHIVNVVIFPKKSRNVTKEKVVLPEKRYDFPRLKSWYYKIKLKCYNKK